MKSDKPQRTHRSCREHDGARRQRKWAFLKGLSDLGG